MPETKDPLVSAWYGVEFQGQVQGAFRECTGLGSHNEVVDYKASGPKGEYVMKKVPGRMTWNPITLKRGITDAMDMWKWRQVVEEGKVDDARKNGSIVMFNQQGQEVARWDFVAAWPSKITGPTANANANEIAIEEMEIVHEGYKRVK
jgi:phage tail-like protein